MITWFTPKHFSDYECPPFNHDQALPGYHAVTLNLKSVHRSPTLAQAGEKHCQRPSAGFDGRSEGSWDLDFRAFRGVRVWAGSCCSFFRCFAVSSGMYGPVF